MHAGLGGGIIGLTGLALDAVDRADVDDAAPALLHHVADHLLGHVEHGCQIGLDDRVPVLARHLQEHAVPRNARIVDQHIDLAVFRLGAAESIDRGLPVTDVAHRRVEFKAQCLLLIDPLLEITRRTATRDHLEAILVKTLADRRANAAHTPRDVRYFLTH
ncbi:hypothetical protein D3C78_1313120 [compost metagenome]